MTVRALTTRVFRLMGELEQIHSRTLDQLLGNLLLLNASVDGVARQTQQKVACHPGNTREVIASLMQGLAAHGLDATRRGTITVTDAARPAERVIQTYTHGN